MISIKKITVAAALLSLALPFAAFAQTASSSQTTPQTKRATLIADVNISEATITVANNMATGGFTAVSSMGNQADIHYGLVVRNKDGATLGATPTLGKFSLVEKVPTTISINAKVPTVSQTGAVYLNLTNASGLVLAAYKVGEVSASTMKKICTVNELGATCMASATSTLSISVFDGGAQGALVGTTSVSLTPGTTGKTMFADVMKNLDGGRYLIVGSVTTNGQEVEQFVTEYTNPGTRAKIGSLSLARQMADGTDTTTYKAVVYTTISGFGTSTSFVLSLAASGCAETIQIPVTSAVSNMMFSTSCTNGTAVVTLLQDGNAVDTASQTFSVPQVAESKSSPLSRNMLGLIALVAIALGLVFYILNRHHHTMHPPTPGTPATPTPQVPPVASSSGAVAAAVLMFAILATFAPTKASAATYAISGDSYFWFCASGGGCSSDGNEQVILTSGTVTVNTNANGSLTASQPYTVTVSQTNPNTLAGSGSGRWGVCYDNRATRDASGDGIECDATDVTTKVYINKSPVNTASTAADATVAAHTASQTLTFTAPASGSVKLSFWQFPNTPDNGVQCNPIWLSPTVKCQQGIDTGTFDSVSMPVASAPTVNVQFSLLQKMFSVFALSN